MKTVVVGIDGGEWNVIDPLIQQESLPNISNLIDTGVRCELESVTPPVSPPAWTSIQTGTNPGKHGIYDFGKFDETYQRRSINSTDRQATPFWEILNENNIQTGLFKLPFTYPPGDVDGFFVTGFPTPNTVDDYGVPHGITDEIGDSKHLFEDYDYRDRGEFERFKENLVTVADHQHDVLMSLLDERDPEFLMTVYDGADRLQHFFWKYVDKTHPRYESEPGLASAFREYYQSVDRGIGELLESAGPETNIIVLSDHGFEKLSYDIYIDEWLEQNGFLSREPPNRPDHFLRRGVNTTIEQSWKVVKKLGLDKIVKSVAPSSAVERGRARISESNRLRTIDWEQTDAFFTTLSGQAIHINLEDRFINATVSSEEYDNVVTELQSALRELRHPDTEEPLIKNVFRSDDIFTGEMLDEAPDLIVETKSGFTLKGGRSDSLVKPSAQHGTDRSGDHRSTGILIANGPAFSNGDIEAGASVLDIAPTLLYLHDCPIPTTVDGDVLTKLFNQAAVSERSIEWSTDYREKGSKTRRWSAEEEKEIEERLNDMGYLG